MLDGVGLGRADRSPLTGGLGRRRYFRSASQPVLRYAAALPRRVATEVAELSQTVGRLDGCQRSSGIRVHP